MIEEENKPSTWRESNPQPQEFSAPGMCSTAVLQPLPQKQRNLGAPVATDRDSDIKAAQKRVHRVKSWTTLVIVVSVSGRATVSSAPNTSANKNGI